MEKYGVKKDILHTELRDREAQLMQKMAGLIGSPGEKTASQKISVEKELQQVRNKLTELDTKDSESDDA